MATVMKKVKRAGKRASKYQYTANFQSVVVECVKEKWLARYVAYSNVLESWLPGFLTSCQSLGLEGAEGTSLV